jgi:hypothetical protein
MILRTHTLRPGWKDMDPHELLRLLEVADADQHVEADNIMCVNGLTQMIQAMLWSSIADQNANMGSPYDATFMYPVYGAIGTGTVTNTGPPINSSNPPAATDTTLIIEQARTIVASAGATNASIGGDPEIVWSFLFGAPVAPATITEAGVFLCATIAVNNGFLLDHALISPTVAQSTSQLLTLTVDITVGNP